MIDKSNIAKLIQETTQEVFDKNSEALNNPAVLSGTIELAVQLSCLTTLKLLQKLGVVEEFTD